MRVTRETPLIEVRDVLANLGFLTRTSLHMVGEMLTFAESVRCSTDIPSKSLILDIENARRGPAKRMATVVFHGNNKLWGYFLEGSHGDRFAHHYFDLYADELITRLRDFFAVDAQ